MARVLPADCINFKKSFRNLFYYSHLFLWIYAIDNSVAIEYNRCRKRCYQANGQLLMLRQNDRSLPELSGHLSFMAIIIANTKVSTKIMYATDITSPL